MYIARLPARKISPDLDTSHMFNCFQILDVVKIQFHRLVTNSQANEFPSDKTLRDDDCDAGV